MVFIPSLTSASAIFSDKPVLSSVTNTVLFPAIFKGAAEISGAFITFITLRGVSILSESGNACSDLSDVAGLCSEVVDGVVTWATSGCTGKASGFEELPRYSDICPRVFKVPMISGETAGSSGICSSRADKISTRLMESIPSSASISMSRPSISTGYPVNWPTISSIVVTILFWGLSERSDIFSLSKLCWS